MKNLKNCEMNNFSAMPELCAFYIEYKKVNFMAIMLNILCKHSFCDFVKIPKKFLPSLVKNNY